MGFRNPVTSLRADQITGQLVGTQLAADAIDGKVITGATLRTDAAGNRVVVYDTVVGGVIELWAGGFPDEVPGSIAESADAVNKSMTISGGYRSTQANAGGVPAVTFRPGALGSLDLAGGMVNVGTIASEVDLWGTIRAKGNVYTETLVHFEWTTSGVNVPTATLTAAGALTKDTAASAGTGPTIFAGDRARAGAKGIYALSFFVSLNAQTSGRSFAEIQVAGATAARVVFSGEETVLVTIPAIQLDTTQSVQGVVYQSSGAARTLASRLRMTLLERL